MKCFIFALALLGVAVTATQAQDTIPNLKGLGQERASRLSLATIATILVHKRRPLRRASATSSRPTSWRVKTAGWFRPLLILGRRYARSHSPGRLRARQRSSAPTWTALSDHSDLARPHGEVSHRTPRPKQMNHRHLPHNRSGGMVVIARTATLTLSAADTYPLSTISLVVGLVHQHTTMRDHFRSLFQLNYPAFHSKQRKFLLSKALQIEILRMAYFVRLKGQEVFSSSVKRRP